MPQMTIQQAMQIALQHQQTGRLADAEQLYRQVLAAQPRHADALHLLGLIAAQNGQFAIAADLIEKAIAVQPNVWAFYDHLGSVLLDLGHPKKAVIAFQKAVVLAPQNAASHANLARSLASSGQLVEAVSAFQNAARLDPASAEILCNLGYALQATGQSSAAIEALEKSIAMNPHVAEAHNNLAAALKKQARLSEALKAARRAVEINPLFFARYSTLASVLLETGDFAGVVTAANKALEMQPNSAAVCAVLGAALAELGQPDQAVAACCRSMQIDPDVNQVSRILRDTLRAQDATSDAEISCRKHIDFAPEKPNAYVNLALILMNQGEYDEAIAMCRRALELQTDHPDALDNLAHALGYQGHSQEAVAILQRGVAIKPDNPLLHSNLIFASCYLPGESVDGNLHEARRWAGKFSDPLADRIRPHDNDRSQQRKLKIGYVSPDFRTHPVARFAWPLIANHDRSEFEIHCFSNVFAADQITKLFQQKADRWHDATRLDDDALADQIRREKIDILVDMAGHSRGNRLLVFARKPAPVQITWLGFPATTGLSAIDYRLTDAWADPPGSADSHCTEKLIRLPKTAWCYQPLFEAQGNPLPPSQRSGNSAITFGCFNNFLKLNEPMLQLWAEILHRVPGSRLMLKSVSYSSDAFRISTLRSFAAMGLPVDRVDLLGWSDSSASHLTEYDRIDIALDTFPYHGTTTTCEALWMGVPVITLAGTTHLSRVGVSLLSNAGLEDLIAGSRESYVDIAVALAEDAQRLDHLRKTLRERLMNSPLMDAVGFTREVEAVCRQMFNQWASD
jgi:protein O-GlcNAc transferase